MTCCHSEARGSMGGSSADSASGAERKEKIKAAKAKTSSPNRRRNTVPVSCFRFLPDIIFPPYPFICFKKLRFILKQLIPVPLFPFMLD